MNKKQLIALLSSYGRSVLGAAATLYLSGVTNPADLAYSLLGALLPVAIRYINPKDQAFGRIPSVQVVEEVLAKVEPVKAPVKKPAAKPAAKK